MNHMKSHPYIKVALAGIVCLSLCANVNSSRAPQACPVSQLSMHRSLASPHTMLAELNELYQTFGAELLAGVITNPNPSPNLNPDPDPNPLTLTDLTTDPNPNPNPNPSAQENAGVV